MDTMATAPGKPVLPGNADDAEAAAVLGDLAAARGPSKTFCPSEAARRLANRAGDPDAWRDRLSQVRRVAERMVAEGQLVATQRGRIVDPATARGPIRLRLPRDDGA
jgi:hypothetical protein